MKYVKENIVLWGNNVKHIGMKRIETQVPSTVTIGRTVRYPLSVMTMTKDNEIIILIDKEFRWAVLGKMDMVITASAVTIAGPI